MRLPGSARLRRSTRIRPLREPAALAAHRRAAGLRRRDALGPLALGVVAAVALSACATASGSGATGPGKLTKATGLPLPAASSSSPPSTSAAPAAKTRQQQAIADADSILASFAVPTGARRLSANSAVAKSGVLKYPPQTPATPDLVDKAQWWVAPGSPQAVLAWESAHVPHRFAAAGEGSGNGSGGGGVFWSDDFSLPNIPALFNERDLLVTAVPDGQMTAIRVDGQVSWLPARAAGERVPAAAQAVTVSMNIGMNQGRKKAPAPVTITDPAKVRALVNLLNGLPPFPPGVFHCPADFGASVTLTFLAAPGGPALAVATADLAGCDGVSFSIGGKAQPELAGPGTDTGPRILAAAGLRWALPVH